MTERAILTGVAWADFLISWIIRILSAGLILAGLVGIAAIIWGITRQDGDGH